MNPRTTGVLFLVALLFGGFVYLIEFQGRELAEPPGQLFPGLEASDVTSLAIEADGERVRAERRGGSWQVVEPVDFPAEEGTLDGIARALAGLSIEGEIDDPQPFDEYGLGEASPVLRFRAGDEEQTLRLGRDTPLGSNAYARVGRSESVVMVPEAAVDVLTKQPGDLRDRRILPFDPGTIDRIEASWPGGRVVLTLRDRLWRLVSPIEERPSEETVADLLVTLSSLRAEGFEDAPPPDVESGFDAPVFAAVLSGPATSEAAGAGMRRELRFAIGSVATSEGELVAQGLQRSLYRISAESLDALPRSVDAYRFRLLARYPVAETQRFELVFRDPGAEPLRVEGRRDRKWKTEPEAMAAGNASRLLHELSQLEAVGIEAEAMSDAELAAVGLQPPRVSITVWGERKQEGGEEKVLAEIDLGSVVDDGVILARARKSGAGW